MAEQYWIITTAVGTGERGFAGDGGPAARAVLNGPFDIGFDPGGNLYFSDTFNHRIRRVDARTGIITTVAGSGAAGYAGDRRPGDPGRVQRALRHRGRPRPATSMSPTATITACAGSTAPRASSPPSPGTAGPGSPVTAGQPRAREWSSRMGSAFDPAQQLLFIADVADNRVRVVDLARGTIATFAGTGEAAHSGDGGPAAAAGVFGARAVKVAADGTVYILERQGSSLRAVDPRTGVITTVAGTGARGYSGDGGAMLAAVFDAPKEMTIDPGGDLLIVDTENHAIRRIDMKNDRVDTIAGGRKGGEGDGGPARQAGLGRPHGVGVGPDGAIYIGDTENHRIRKLTRAG